MVATNPSVAELVHRNLVTKSHKTMAAANPVAKYTRCFDRYFMVSVLSSPIKSPLLPSSSVRGRSATRIMAANPEAIMPSPNLTGVQFFTECQFLNFSGQNLTLEDSMYWHGYGDAPESISNNPSTVEFKHFGDAIGSVGAVSYLIGDNVRWIIAWSNSVEDQLKLNKVYSEMSEVCDRGVDWGLIREALAQSVSRYKAIYNGYSADLMIDPTNTTPTMTATLNS